MRKEDYLKRLSELLADIPADEREEALTYYAEYFEDAGAEESEVIKEISACRSSVIATGGGAVFG